MIGLIMILSNFWCMTVFVLQFFNFFSTLDFCLNKHHSFLVFVFVFVLPKLQESWNIIHSLNKAQRKKVICLNYLLYVCMCVCVLDFWYCWLQLHKLRILTSLPFSSLPLTIKNTTLQKKKKKETPEKNKSVWLKFL